MPATTTPTDVSRRRPHDWVVPAEPPPASGLRTVWADRLTVVGLGVCVVALLLLADALDAGVVLAAGAAGAVLCWRRQPGARSETRPRRDQRLPRTRTELLGIPAPGEPSGPRQATPVTPP